MQRLLVIGGSDAGISAGLRARELDPDIEVTVAVADAYPNFSICGLPFYVSGETPDWRSLAHRTREEIEATGVRLLLDHRAELVDARSRTVLVSRPDGGGRTLSYDQLVIGTGAQPVRPPIDGIDRPGVHVLHTMDHVFAVHYLVTANARSAVVVGAGYIGVEMADALTHRGLGGSAGRAGRLGAHHGRPAARRRHRRRAAPPRRRRDHRRPYRADRHRA